MTSNDPLTTLIVDADNLDRSRIVEVLRERIALDQATSRLVMMPAFLELQSIQKILAVMLMRRVALLLNSRNG